MNLTSQSFQPWQTLDPRLAFAEHDATTHVHLAGNRNPQLAWENVPAGTLSLALLCYDDDVPSQPTDVNQEDRSVPLWLERARFFHWVLVDLAPTRNEIVEAAHSNGVVARGKSAGASPDGGLMGINDYTSWFAGDEEMKGDYYGYDGPCPPWNDTRTHAYVFHLLALDVLTLGLSGKFTGDQVLEASAGHVLAEAKLAGLYRTNPA
ncbi:MAG: Raf kinase inhibitor-like YbhB/YbcL family protein [Hyphomicrobiaceae bacterium]|jgi:Raf kinase inhibitor-like YbhB/YbcL family protein